MRWMLKRGNAILFTGSVSIIKKYVISVHKNNIFAVHQSQIMVAGPGSITN